MPDAEASRKRQISDQRIPSDLTTQAEAASSQSWRGGVRTACT